MKHKQELIDLLMADAKLRYQYADYEGNTCAIGGMAAAFGWETKPLIDTNNKPYNSQSVDVVINTSARMVRPLKRAIKYFALTPEQVKLIQKANNRWDNIHTRHDDLKELVESWEESK